MIQHQFYFCIVCSIGSFCDRNIFKRKFRNCFVPGVFLSFAATCKYNKQQKNCNLFYFIHTHILYQFCLFIFNTWTALLFFEIIITLPWFDFTSTISLTSPGTYSPVSL